MSPLYALFFVVACKEPEPTDTPEPPVVLEAPDLGDLDVPSAFQEALALALTLDLRRTFGAHRGAFERMRPGCPDVYAGTPDLEDRDLPADEGGVAWSDSCTTPQGVAFDGDLWWTTVIDADGDTTTAEGLVVEGERRLVGDAIVRQGDDLLLEFDGEATDALTTTTAPDFSAYTYSSLVQGRVGGSEVGDDARLDVYLRYAAGEARALEARGNAYFPEARIAGRFDSLHFDLAYTAPESTPPNGCALEPAGFLSVRDEDAFWYDLVFEPRYPADVTGGDYENEPYEGCDGCGTLYVRGLEQTIEVCPDFSFVWADGTLTPPDKAEYALSWRDVLGDD